MPRSSGSSIRTRTIGRSPEIPWAHRAVGPDAFCRSTAAAGRSVGVRVENPAGQILEQVGLIHANPEMVELDLCPRPGERDRPLERRRVAILVGQGQGGVARRADERGEDEAGALPRHETDPPSEAEDWIEHRAGRVREGPPVDDRHRRTDPATPAEEASAVGLVLSPSPGLAFDNDDVRRPDRRVRRGAAPAGRQQRPEIGDPFRLDEEAGEGLVRGIRRRRGQHELGVGGQLDLSRLPPRFMTDTRRSSASSSGETSTSSVVVMAPSRRYSSARSSEKVTR